MFKSKIFFNYVMKHVIICPFDGFVEPIFEGLKEFATEKVVLLVPSKYGLQAKGSLKEFEKLKIPVEIFEINDETSLEETFEAFSRIKAREKGKPVVVNLGGASGMLSCASLSACFVNGLRAFEIMDNKLILFPVLQFSYYDMLSEKKLKILSTLSESGFLESLESLGKKANIGPSLLNYHIYGSEKKPGLKELGFVEIDRVKGKVSIRLSTLGRLLLKQKKEN